MQLCNFYNFGDRSFLHMNRWVIHWWPLGDIINPMAVFNLIWILTFLTVLFDCPIEMLDLSYVRVLETYK